ncbi:hypothetical protein [Dactylosporangium sp. CA-139066]|uniref:hypothetical protein n=1 Tax=Dactylosporangium sp. CA-139066 TaxID=3239930 RepID=UPI003D91542A
MTPDYRRAAHVAGIVAGSFAVVALAADRAGCTVQGYTGIAFGGVAFGAAVWYAALHDRQQRIAAGQGA